MSFITPYLFVTGFYSLTLFFQEKSKINYNNLLFSIMSSILLIGLLFPIIYLTEYAQYIIYSLFFLSMITLLRFVYYKHTIIKRDIVKNKWLFIAYFFFSFLTLIPINGADSYAYHLAWPKSLIDDSTLFFDKSFMEFGVVGLGEIVNYISLSIGLENLQSFLAFTVLTFYLFKEKRLNKLIYFLATPIFVKFIFDQKPFLLPAIILVIFLNEFINKFETKNINKLDYLGILLAISFFANTKYPFIVISSVILLYMFFLCRNLKNYSSFFLLAIVVFIFNFLPVPLIKFLEFSDPFYPFLNGFFNNYDADVESLKIMYTSWDGFLVKDKNFIFEFFRNTFNFIIPTSPFSFLDIFGISVVLIFIARFKSSIKRNIFFICFITTLVLVIYTNFQSRWFLFVFLFMTICHDHLILKKNIKNIFDYMSFAISAMVVSLFIFFFLKVSIITYNKNFEEAKNQHIYLYEYIKEIEQVSKDSKVLSNTRGKFHSKNFVGYKYKDFSNNNLFNIYDEIKFGFFSLGGNKPYTSEFLQNKTILSDFKTDCYMILKIFNSKVAKRNLFSNNDYESFVFIKFIKPYRECI